MRYLYISLLISSTAHCFAQDAATIVHDRDSLKLIYGNATIFSGKIETGGGRYVLRQQTQVIKGCTWQIITIRAEGLKPFEVDGRIAGSGDAIACESDPAEGRLKVVRQVVGRSHSLLNGICGMEEAGRRVVQLVCLPGSGQRTGDKRNGGCDQCEAKALRVAVFADRRWL
ncbi:MAG TPA: hypothetical protein VL978_15815 [Puia sp.]|nr:hypothetical protein [Puia sp.]